MTTDRHQAHAHEPPSPRFYVLLWGVLVFLTVVTVGITYLDLKKFAILAALLIATVKASLVLMYFMHLRFESRMFTFMLLVGLGALMIFIGLTFTDMGYRFY